MPVIGVDVGTSAVKAAAYDGDWATLAGSSRPYAGQQEKAATVLSMAAVREAVAEVCREVGTAVSGQVAAVAVAAAADIVFPADSSGVPIADPPAAQDIGNAGMTRAWLDRNGAASVLHHTGLPLTDLWAGARIVHALRAAPDRIEPPARWVFLEEAVLSWLGAVPKVSRSTAARSMLYDNIGGEWSAELCRLAGVVPGQFAHVVDGGTLAGEVTQAAAVEFGVPEGTPLVVGGHDTICSCVANAASPAVPMWSSGTADTIAYVSPSPPPHRSAFQLVYRCASDLWCELCPNLNGGGAVAWMSRTVLGRELDEFDDDPQGLDALPLMIPLLGRTGMPNFASGGTGGIVGLGYHHTGSDLARAAMLGVVYETLYAYQSTTPGPIDAVTLTGGGARSTWLNKVRVAALEVPGEIRRHHNSAGLGAAMLAIQATTGRLPEPDHSNPVIDRVCPSAELTQQVKGQFADYQRWRTALAAEEDT